jgi:hypothetical protein
MTTAALRHAHAEPASTPNRDAHPASPTTTHRDGPTGQIVRALSRAKRATGITGTVTLAEPRTAAAMKRK